MTSYYAIDLYHNTSTSEQLVAAKALAQQHLDTHHITLDDLEELSDIMSEMLRKQQEVEVLPVLFCPRPLH